MAPSFLSLGTCRGIFLLLLSFHADALLNSDTGLADELVSKQSAAGVGLFSYEAVQLTESGLLKLNDQETLAKYAPLFAFGNGSTNPQEPSERAEGCKTYPGDALWPSAELWGVFDNLLGGAISPIVPIASPCYMDSAYHNYDSLRCVSITEGWGKESTHYDDPGSIMSPIYEGKTCLPGTDPAALSNCTQGGYSLYSVNVSNVAQIQLAVNFARSLNLRLLVKNTGHDYNGRSTGYGALSLWTHHLKDIQFIENYATAEYTGPAFKLGAGVQGFELYKAAELHGVSALSGICPTVGVVGGYIQGGGHSPLMQLFGMGADQVLVLEVITAAGVFVTATPSLNSDLYWALLGGGGGTFGIVTSAVLKAHPKVPVTTSTFSFASSNNVSAETFWKGFSAYWNRMPVYNEAKTYSYWSILNVADDYVFTMQPFFATNKTIEQYEALVGPFFKNLSDLGIPYNVTETQHFDSFYPAYQSTFGSYDQNTGAVAGLAANRLVPAENWDNETIRESTLRVLKETVDRSRAVLGYHQAPLSRDRYVNAVNPAFRAEAAQFIIINGVGADAGPEELKVAGEELTYAIMGPLKEATAGGGAYNNEADVGEQNWQQAFWGENYPRLLEIKRKWDPTELFYVHHGVGSEEWHVMDHGGVQTQNGKLCRASGE
ncbi:hypothetical protein diail_1672 [Diaporthe ilicicola]|nr:hypothetical protein diail_1672 [Diaporthe ilicicola]